MKLLIYLWAFVAVVITAGCSSVDDAPQIKNEESQAMLAPGHVPRSVSCGILNDVLVKANFKTSGGVASLTCMANESDCRAYNADGEELTRADEEDARFYVFNIGTEGDYAIMGAHTSVPPLLVLASGASKPDPNDPDEFKKTITSLPYNMTMLDSLGFGSAIAKPMEKYYDYRNAEYSLLGGVEPLPYKWGPHDPWNMFNQPPSDNPDKPHAANNCTCIAMAMILTNEHYRPRSYMDQQSLDWNLISAYKYNGIEKENPELAGGLEQVASLIHYLSLEDLLNVIIWHEWASFNSLYSIVPAFSSLGYNTQRVSYSFEQLKTSISKGYPVLAYGTGTKNEGLHSWVMSAILEAYVPYAWVVIDDPRLPDNWNYETQYLIHHNWGWENQGDGYYFEGIQITSGEDAFLDDNLNILRENDKHPGWGAYKDLHIIIDNRTI